MRKMGFKEFLFILPILILLTVFSLWPILQTFSYSFFDYRLNDQQKSGLYLSDKYNVDLFMETSDYVKFYLNGEKDVVDEEGAKIIGETIALVDEQQALFEGKTGVIELTGDESDKVGSFNATLEENINILVNQYELVNESNYQYIIEELNTSLISSNFTGLKGYSDAIKDDRVHNALINTIIFTIASITIEFILGLGLAVIMNKSIRGRGAVRTISIIPWAIPTAVAALMWSYLYDGASGVIAQMFENIGLIASSEELLLSSTGAMISAIMADVWKTTPYMALLLLAGFQTIPGSVYESAKVDGSGPVYTFFKITLPLIKHSILVALLFRTLDAFRVFDLIYVLTGGGPGGSTETMSVYAYKLMFGQTNFGYGSVIVIIMFLCVALITTLFVKVLGTDLMDTN
ncbi:carbohydrate ABC transporter permease [Vallitalea okinawensis]|uniref:carbohydrate ABC transporter permease n=1 Tax=Vallitalea okinawensis TaxID=2078660 RepID=UPI000CFE032D|nr:sugar ABC transporter permease [Vallitalea okinawensis]